MPIATRQGRNSRGTLSEVLFFELFPAVFMIVSAIVVVLLYMADRNAK